MHRIVGARRFLQLLPGGQNARLALGIARAVFEDLDGTVLQVVELVFGERGRVLRLLFSGKGLRGKRKR